VGAYTAQYLVALQLKYGEPRWEAGQRLLDPEHFLFRGGDTNAPHTSERRGLPQSGTQTATTD
jgi:hypothetical protein